MGTANTLKCKGTGNTNTVQCCSDPEQKKINMQKIKKLLPTYLIFLPAWLKLFILKDKVPVGNRPVCYYKTRNKISNLPNQSLAK
jgi:hypothetical protein